VLPREICACLGTEAAARRRDGGAEVGTEAPAVAGPSMETVVEPEWRA
jgi:hypothetical protein